MSGPLPSVGGGVEASSGAGDLASNKRLSPPQQSVGTSFPPWSSDKLALVGLSSPASPPHEGQTLAEVQPPPGGAQPASPSSPTLKSKSSTGPLLRRTSSWPACLTSTALRSSPTRLGAAPQPGRPTMGTCAAARTGAVAGTVCHVPLSPNGSLGHSSQQQTAIHLVGTSHVSISLFGFKISSMDFPELPRRQAWKKSDSSTVPGVENHDFLWEYGPGPDSSFSVNEIS